MKKKENKLADFFTGDLLAELPLSLSLLSSPSVDSKGVKRINLAPCAFYRTMYYHCHPSGKIISRIIDLSQD